MRSLSPQTGTPMRGETTNSASLATARSLAGESYAVVALARAAPSTDLALVHDGDSSRSPVDVVEHLSVGNSGQPARGVRLTYTLPAYTMFVSATPTQGTCQGSTQ